MLRLTRVSPALLLLALIFFASVEARADAIAITSGYVDASSPNSQDQRYRSYGFDFSGNNLHIRGGDGDGPSQRVLTPGCYPCTPGQPFYINYTAGLFAPTPTESMEFNGQSYIGWAEGPLNIATDQFIMPPAPSDGSVITLTGHFTMSGSISFEPHLLGEPHDQVFFVSDVYGSGTVTVTLQQIFGAYHVWTTRYDFQPTPEPTTLVLLGSGIAGLAARQRRRSRLRKIQKEVS